MKKYLIALLITLPCLFGQDPTPAVIRPQPLTYQPSATATTVTVKWFHYSVYLEQVLAVRDKQITDLRNGLGAISFQNLMEKLTAIENKVLAIKFPPTTPVIPPIGANEAKAGSTLTLQASADGNPTPTWVWKKNGNVMPQWSSATLVLPALTENDSATYSAVATNSAGSADASITINVVP